MVNLDIKTRIYRILNLRRAYWAFVIVHVEIPLRTFTSLYVLKLSSVITWDFFLHYWINSIRILKYLWKQKNKKRYYINISKQSVSISTKTPIWKSCQYSSLLITINSTHLTSRIDTFTLTNFAQTSFISWPVQTLLNLLLVRIICG